MKLKRRQVSRDKSRSPNDLLSLQKRFENLKKSFLAIRWPASLQVPHLPCENADVRSRPVRQDFQKAQRVQLAHHEAPQAAEDVEELLQNLPALVGQQPGGLQESLPHVRDKRCEVHRDFHHVRGVRESLSHQEELHDPRDVPQNHRAVPQAQEVVQEEARRVHVRRLREGVRDGAVPEGSREANPHVSPNTT